MRHKILFVLIFVSLALFSPLPTQAFLCSGPNTDIFGWLLCEAPFPVFYVFLGFIYSVLWVPLLLLLFLIFRRIFFIFIHKKLTGEKKEIKPFKFNRRWWRLYKIYFLVWIVFVVLFVLL